MATKICFLRAVNVGRKNRVKMENFRLFFDGIGVRVAIPYIQSGNFLLQGDDNILQEEKLQRLMQDQLYIDTVVFLRTPQEYADIIATAPYAKIKPFVPRRAMLTLLQHPPASSARETLREALGHTEYAYMTEGELYTYIPETEEYAQRAISNALIEKITATAATTRNWATIQKMAQLLRQYPENGVPS